MAGDFSATMAAADRPTRVALAASLLLHASVVALVLTHPRASGSMLATDVWGGDTLEIDSTPPSVPERSQTTSGQAPHEPAPARVEPVAARAERGVSDATQEHRVPLTAPGTHAEPDVDPAAGGETDAGGAGRTQGTQDADSSVRSLAKAFTRAIPFGARADPVWTTLPLGPAGTMTVVFELGDDGQILRAEPKEKEVPLALRHLLERTLILLKMGRFAPQSPGQSGREVLRIEARLDSAAADSTYGESEQVMSLDYEPPTLNRPGRAAFRLGTGRRLEVRVAIVTE
jgi:hypothetical protein